MNGGMQFNPIGLVLTALELAGVSKPDSAVVLDKLAAEQDKLGQAVARSPLGGAVVAGQGFVDALRADAGAMRQAAEGLRATAKREAAEAAAANDKPSATPAPAG